MAQDRNHDRGGRARGESNEREGGGDHNAVGRAVPRPEVVAPRVVRPTVVAPRVVAPRVVSPRSYGYPAYRSYGYPAYRSYGYPVYRSYGYRPSVPSAPHFGLGFVIGYPVPYTYAYPYPVPVYGYAAPAAPVVVGPGSSVYGGVSLEMTPD